MCFHSFYQTILAILLFYSERAVKALWFAETFGLLPESNIVKDSGSDDGVKFVVPLVQSGMINP